MKKKDLNKRLVLNKETVADLAKNEMNGLHAGNGTYESCYISLTCNTEFLLCTDPILCVCTKNCTRTCPATWQEWC